MEIKIIADPSKAEIERFEGFAKSNWGEESYDGDVNLDFFDLHRIIFTLEKDGEILSGLVVHFKMVNTARKIYSMAGIGGVVTHLDMRRKGFALKVLKYCAEYLSDRGIDFAMLCTDIDRLGNLYGKAGFIPLEKSYYFLDKNDVKKESGDGMFLILNDEIGKEEIVDKNQEIFVGRSNF